MLPIGPLMMEHRLIERMIAVMREKSVRARAERVIGVSLSRCDGGFHPLLSPTRRTMVRRRIILFREAGQERSLGGRPAVRCVSWSTTTTMAEGLSGSRREQRNEYAERRQPRRLARCWIGWTWLARVHPEHIRKEDQVFFPASMTYLTQEEKATMLGEFWEFDLRMIHEKYEAVVEALG